MNITINPNLSTITALDRHNSYRLEADIRRLRRTARAQRRAARAAHDLAPVAALPVRPLQLQPAGVSVPASSDLEHASARVA